MDSVSYVLYLHVQTLPNRGRFERRGNRGAQLLPTRQNLEVLSRMLAIEDQRLYRNPHPSIATVQAKAMNVVITQKRDNGIEVPKDTMRNLNKYIQCELAEEYGLIGRHQEKYACDEQDLFDIASFPWQKDDHNYKTKDT